MPDKKVAIGVEVVGGPQAKAELTGVQQGVAGVGAAAPAATAASAAVGQVGHATKEAAGHTGVLGAATEGYNRAGGHLVSMVLGRINPALGEMSHWVMMGVHGIGHMTTTLLALGGVAAAIGVIAAVFEAIAEAAKKAAEAVERVQKAHEEARKQGGEQRYDIAKDLAKLGIYGRTSEAQAAEILLQQHGVAAEQARATAEAGAIMAAAGQPFNEQEYLAGLTTRGMEAPTFKSRGQAIAQIAAIQAAGRTPEAQQAAATFHAETEAAAKQKAPSEQAAKQSAIDTYIAELHRQRPELTEKELGAVRELAEVEGGRSERVQAGEQKYLGWWRRYLARGLRGKEQDLLTDSERNAAIEEHLMESEADLGGTATLGGLIYRAEEARSRAALSGGIEPAVPTTQPVTINVTNVTNIDTNYGEYPSRKQVGISQADLATGWGVTP